MKLNPPASSSDLEAAREIARRIHMRRHREDLPSLDAPPPASWPPARPAPPPPLPPAPPPPTELEVAPELPAPPSWDERVGEAPPLDEAPPVDEAPPMDEAPPAEEAIDALADLHEPAVVVEEPRPGDNPLPDVEVEDTGVSPEEMVGTPELEVPPVPPSPFDLDLEEAGVPRDDVLVASAPPSWDDIVESCVDLAHADAAMLIDPAGQVFAAHGDWPAPGPETIATKLVSTMERALKDAPTRSISAPLSGKHLTAWRVPLAEGLVTVAFLGDVPVRSETRPIIDTEIHRGAGA